MALASGTRLGPYEITAAIGAGGMGEVYRAHDTALNRDVAIKVLPDSLVGDPDRLARFRREAEALAALNHPNIAHVYGLEKSGDTPAIVMELVEGPTLAERLRAGPISLDEALPIARQIAEGLEAAHERNIIHRDLKPANVKVTDDGTVKVLDFGLAKAVEPPGEPTPEMANSPTLTARATQMGVVLGTAAYMAPEQAKGKPVDKRVDVWAFGAVLFEMLAGKRPFDGSDVSEIMASVLKIDPDWKALPATTPQAIERLLRRCLVKRREDRLHDIGDARLEIEEAVSLGYGTGSPAVFGRPAYGAKSRASPALMTAVVAVVSALVAGFATWVWRGTPVRPLVLLSILSPREIPVAELALSPDGRQLVYVAGQRPDTVLYSRPLDRNEATPIPGTEHGRKPFFSPDGNWVGFSADNDLKKMSIDGGAPFVICEGCTHLTGSAADWAPDGQSIVFERNGSLWQVSADRGEPWLVKEPSASRSGDYSYASPEFLPDGTALLVEVMRLGDADRTSIELLDLDTGVANSIVPEGGQPVLVSTGHLLFVHAGTLYAAPFDTAERALAGDSVAVLQDNATSDQGIGGVSVSRSGTLAVVEHIADPSQGGSGAAGEVVWVDREGNAEPVDPGRLGGGPQLSPDGRRIAFHSPRAGLLQIWVHDVDTRQTQMLTSEGSNTWPVWSSDGARIAYTSGPGGAGDIRWAPSDFSGDEATIIAATERGLFPLSTFQLLNSGDLLFYEVHPEEGRNIYVVTPGGDAVPRPVVRTSNNERAAAVSPNGRWIAFVSDLSGTDQVYVQSFPDGAKRQMVWEEAEGSWEPAWNPNGKELFYRAGTKMIAVPVTTESQFTAGEPQVLFDRPEYSRSVFRAVYDVASNGQRFLMTRVGAESGEPVMQIHVILNFLEELRATVPVR